MRYLDEAKFARRLEKHFRSTALPVESASREEFSRDHNFFPYTLASSIYCVLNVPYNINKLTPAIRLSEPRASL